LKLFGSRLFSRLSRLSQLSQLSQLDRLTQLKRVGIVLVVLLATGCAFPGVYRIDIPQGNIITQDMVDQLRPGLTKRQVTFILGTPLIRDTFDQDRWDYLYSYQPGGGERAQERLAVFFDDNGELTHFEGDFEQTPENLQFPQQAQSGNSAAP
jgi:outer membrane protein assembly factor BamE (lipoprotein component of BamABCDE complex)